MASTTLHVLQGAPPSPTAIITNPRLLQQLREGVIRNLLHNQLLQREKMSQGIMMNHHFLALIGIS